MAVYIHLPGERGEMSREVANTLDVNDRRFPLDDRRGN